MIGAGMAIVWLGILALALVTCAVVERRVRLASLRSRNRWAPLRADWGFDVARPPVHSLVARGLAGCARLVRTRSRVLDHSLILRRVARIVSFLALASGLVLIPFAGSWEAGESLPPLIVVDLRFGLIAIVLIVLLMGLAEVGVGLADRNPWSRLGSVDLASQVLGGLGLFILVLAPLALGPSSFRLHDLVTGQQEAFAPLFWLPASWQGVPFDFARGLRWPGWNLFIQPLTAILFLPAMHLLIRRPWAMDPIAGNFTAAGFGLDSDPGDLYWGRLEARLAKGFSASLFVTLFLGAGGIPFVHGSDLIAAIAPLVGSTLPALLVVVLGIGVFFAKLVIVLLLGEIISRRVAALRSDQRTRLVAYRLRPLAWANLLLVSAMTLLAQPFVGEG